MDAFTLAEPLYAICESWAEEPSVPAWDAGCAGLCAWLIRANRTAHLT